VGFRFVESNTRMVRMHTPPAARSRLLLCAGGALLLCLPAQARAQGHTPVRETRCDGTNNRDSALICACRRATAAFERSACLAGLIPIHLARWITMCTLRLHVNREPRLFTCKLFVAFGQPCTRHGHRTIVVDPAVAMAVFRLAACCASHQPQISES
jgi:hypothetical protein